MCDASVFLSEPPALAGGKAVVLARRCVSGSDVDLAAAFVPPANAGGSDISANDPAANAKT